MFSSSNIALLNLQEIANLQNFLQNKLRNVDSVLEILQSHPFLMSGNFKNAGLPMARSQTDY